jgi:AraC-like DNA-binding protein
MKGNAQTNGIWGASPQADNGILEALAGSSIYRKFAGAFGDLTGFNLVLLPTGVTPLSTCSVPVCRAGQLVGLLQTTRVEPAKSQRRRSLAAASLMEVFAQHLELISDQAAFQARNGEPALIQRAKAYIQANYATELSLSGTASSLNVSRFYLCKLFRKSTGSTFSRYVSAVRIERARRLLANRSLRVSEIAFDVGFQSLTHFNREFRNAIGHSPTEYRKRATMGA